MCPQSCWARLNWHPLLWTALKLQSSPLSPPQTWGNVTASPLAHPASPCSGIMPALSSTELLSDVPPASSHLDRAESLVKPDQPSPKLLDKYAVDLSLTDSSQPVARPAQPSGDLQDKGSRPSPHLKAHACTVKPAQASCMLPGGTEDGTDATAAKGSAHVERMSPHVEVFVPAPRSPASSVDAPSDPAASLASPAFDHASAQEGVRMQLPRQKPFVSPKESLPERIEPQPTMQSPWKYSQASLQNAGQWTREYAI